MSVTNAPVSPIMVHLKQLENRCKSGHLTVHDIVETLGGESHYLLIFFLILPFLQPIPMLGLSTPFGLLIAIVAFFAFLKQTPRVPARWGKKEVSAKMISQLVQGAEKMRSKVVKIIHPRLQILLKLKLFQLINLFVLVVLSVLLALPLPIPFSNALPAWGIFLQALGHLEEDGVLIIISYIEFVICIVAFGILLKGAQLSITEILKINF